MGAYLRSGANSNSGGRFAASVTTGEMVRAARRTVADLPRRRRRRHRLRSEQHHADPRVHPGRRPHAGAGRRGRSPPASSTIPTSPRGASRPGDAGATVVLAPFDPGTGRLSVDTVVERIGPKTRWVTITGASNALGTIPDVAAVVEAAHAAGARVFVDAVHLTPHRPVDIGALGCDALATSPYKWYGPHAGILWLAADLRDALEPYKVRPAPDTAPERFETGTPAYEAIAATQAAAEFLLTEGMATLAKAETAVFAPLLEGLAGAPPRRRPRPADAGRPDPDGLLLGRGALDRRGRGRARRRADRGLGWPLLRGRGHGRARARRGRRRDPGRGLVLHERRRRRPAARSRHAPAMTPFHTGWDLGGTVLGMQPIEERRR